MKNYLKGILYESGESSLTRLIAITSWAAFLGVSFYLSARGIAWQHYESFAMLTAGGGALTQLTNKFLNKKYDTRERQ